MQGDGDDDEDKESIVDSPAPSNPSTPVVTTTTVSLSQQTSKKNLPRVTLEEIIQTRESGHSIEEMLFTRYKHEYSSKSADLISRSSVLKSIIEGVQNGLDPGIYSVTDKVNWYKVGNKEQFFALIDSLNNRGLREQPLLSNLTNEKSQIVEEYLENERQQERLAGKRPVKLVQRKSDSTPGIDKSLFKCMEDFIEGSLRDSILELEDRIWVAGFGGVQSAEREEWRKQIEEGMAKLIQIGSKKKDAADDGQIGITAMEVDEAQVNGHTVNVNGNGDIDTEGGDHHLVTTDTMEVDGETIKPVKAIPLHLKDDVKEGGERSRCSTPVEEDPENDRTDLVRELAKELLKVSQQRTFMYI